MLLNEEKWSLGMAGAILITLTDPSLMCSVPLQLEKILNVVCQPMVWRDREGRCDGNRKDAFKANPSLSDTRREIEMHPGEKRKWKRRH